MAKASDVANYFLSKVDADAGDLISNLKLQKLMYYAQGYHLALFDKPLFADSIEAWTHGPVVPSIYRKYKGSNGSGLTVAKGFSANDLSKQEKGLLDEVYKVYGQFSAWKLRNMTHQESPWRSTEQSNTITHELLKSFFKTRLA
jgi:uncharacterized phage-associated protein